MCVCVSVYTPNSFFLFHTAHICLLYIQKYINIFPRYFMARFVVCTLILIWNIPKSETFLHFFFFFFEVFSFFPFIELGLVWSLFVWFLRKWGVQENKMSLMHWIFFRVILRYTPSFWTNRKPRKKRVLTRLLLDSNMNVYSVAPHRNIKWPNRLKYSRSHVALIKAGPTYLLFSLFFIHRLNKIKN